MVNSKTVLVVGAGASQEANLPTGKDLKQQIANLLDISIEDYGSRPLSGDYRIIEALKQAVRMNTPQSTDISPYLPAAWLIRDAMPQAISIDSFIDAHLGDENVELCGKLAIVRSILEAEKSSLMYFDPLNNEASLNYQALESKWFNSFWQLLTENCRSEGLQERLVSITLIIFNYDRCIEHFLYHSLQNYYNLDVTEATQLVQGIQIYHPYGIVGHLPWQQKEASIPFGAEPKGQQLLDLVAQIKTFAEGTDPESSEVVAIRQKMLEADIVLFLGFAFHQINLNLLRPEKVHADATREVDYFATAKGISTSDCELIKSELAKLSGVKTKRIYLRNDLACSELLQEFRRSLALS